MNLKHRKILLLYLTVLPFTFSSCSKKKYFEGSIVYEIKYTSSDSRIDTNRLKELYGTQFRFYFKEGNMRSDISNAHFKKSLYIKNNNRNYYQTKDSIYWEDGYKPSEKITSSKSLAKLDTILGHECHSIIVESTSIDQTFERKRTYCYATDLKIDPVWFSKCKINNLNEIYSTTSALYLKMVDELPTFKMEYKAIKIEHQHLEDSIFKTDTKLPLKELL